MNKTKKRLLSYLLLAIGGLNLGGVSNAQPKDANTSNISSEKSKRSLKTSDILTVRNGVDLGLFVTILFGGRKLLNEIDKNKKLQGDDNSLKFGYDILKEKYDSLKKNYEVSVENHESLKHDYDVLEKKCNSLQEAHKSCNLKIHNLKLEVGLSKTHTIKEMKKFDLLKTFQDLFRFCYSQGWRCEDYIELAKEDFEDYDVIAFNAAAYEQGYANVSAYFVAKGEVDKKLTCIAGGNFSELTPVYDYCGSLNYSPGAKKALFKMIDDEGLDEEEVKEKKVLLVSFEDLFGKVKYPKYYLDGSLKFKDDKLKFKDYYIICERYRVTGPWNKEYDYVYYKFLLVKKNEKGIKKEKEKEKKAKEKKMKEEMSDDSDDSDID